MKTRAAKRKKKWEEESEQVAQAVKKVSPLGQKRYQGYKTAILKGAPPRTAMKRPRVVRKRREMKDGRMKNEGGEKKKTKGDDSQGRQNQG